MLRTLLWSLVLLMGCQDGRASQEPVDPPIDAKLVKIPAGPFIMGCNVKVDPNCGFLHKDELPVAEVTLKEFSIQIGPVSERSYQKCLDAGACTGKLDHKPTGFAVSRRTWDEADEYCRWRGLRLP